MRNFFNKAVAEKKPETKSPFVELPVIPSIGEAVLFACMEAIAKGIRFDPQALEAVKKAQAGYMALRSEQSKYSSYNVSRTHEAQRTAIFAAVQAGKPLPETFSLDQIRNDFAQRRAAYFDAIEAVTITSFPHVKTILTQFIEQLDELKNDRIARRDLDIDQDTLAIIREFATKRLDFTANPPHPFASPQSLLDGITKL